MSKTANGRHTEMRKKIAAVLIAGTMTLGFAGVADAGKGNDFKSCFGSNYGQSGLNYGQAKKAPPHPLSGYGLPDVLAAHGPDAGELSLCGDGD